MSTATAGPLDRASLDPPDPQFRLVVGLYIAMLAVPVVLVAASAVGVSGAATLYGLFLVSGLFAVVAVTWGLGTVDGAAERLGNSGLRWLLWLPPVGLAAGSFAVRSSVDAVTIAGFFFGALDLVAGFLVAAMARSRYVKAVLETTPVDTTWHAGWPDSARSRLTIVAGVLVLVALGSMAADGLRWEIGGFWYLGQFLLPFGVILMTVAQPQDYSATRAGLVVERGGFRRLYDWERFYGFSRTDDGIVCHRAHRVDLRFALTDLDDPDTVVGTLGRYLDRTR